MSEEKPKEATEAPPAGDDIPAPATDDAPPAEAPPATEAPAEAAPAEEAKAAEEAPAAEA